MKRILAVDDDNDILQLLEMVLKLHSFHVNTISKWQDIDDSIASFKPDLILLDVSLGGADGRDICKKLKKQEHTRHIPVILFSANFQSEETIRACDAQAFIAKPFNLSDLVNTIGEYAA